MQYKNKIPEAANRPQGRIKIRGTTLITSLTKEVPSDSSKSYPVTGETVFHY